jgi:hypothetical protein
MTELGDEPQSAAALAASIGCHADALDPFLRMLAACDIFERRPDNTCEFGNARGRAWRAGG